MVALITGASSGIGREMSKYLYSLDYDLIIVARTEEKLKQLKEELESSTLNDREKRNIEIKIADVSRTEECIKLYEDIKSKYGNIDLLINNAGFGLYGEFDEIELDKEIQMIDTNIKAVHILTKLFLKDMIEIDNGRILNVASIAGFLAGPLMATYYSSKNYVLRLSQALKIELKKKKSKVKISVLCPGPVDTNFNNVAGVNFALKGLSSSKVAKYAIDKTLKGKFIILPGIFIKLTRFFIKFIPDTIASNVCYYLQKKKEEK